MTFQNQSKLPRLPIPELNVTAKTYLESCKPHLSKHDHDQYTDIVNDFIKPNGLGQILQDRLIAYDKTQPNSWLERWWLQYAYLTWRNSVLVHSNWVIIVRPHVNAPPNLVAYQEGFTDFQLFRAAGFVCNMLNYKDSLEDQTYPAEVTKQGPICMDQFRHIFGVTRVPKPGCDILVDSFPSKAKHIIALAKDQIFIVYVYDPKTGQRLPMKEIEKQFKDVVRQVDSNTPLQPPVGLLSGQHRDKWAEHHGYLLKNPKNAESFKLIESALFAVALDHKIVPHDVTSQAKNTFHGYNAHNRWFDKAISVIVTNDGRIGVNGEHSPCDALVPALMINNAAESEPAQDPANTAKTVSLPAVKRVSWEVDDYIKKAFVEAQCFVDETIADSDMKLLHYPKYGSNFIKKVAKMSPDAFNQLCIQLTFYRLHGYCAGVYETASTRKYLHGRTETCRSLTPASQAFVEAFDNPNFTALEKYALFQKAATAHVEYLKIASNGYGCDRHLLGLKLCLKEGESHEIFTHPVFAKSSKWQLSTSALFPGKAVYGTGFGTVYPDGYGMNYTIESDMMKIGVESKVSCPDTSSAKFIETLQGVYADVKHICEFASKNVNAKL
ncbi:acyltransferase ChoActase/COT/CPT [Globomyces pollinis-pini]|nr:acyltransferase ChoActase/COT/CPT [Globomyces pollinis-pini]